MFFNSKEDARKQESYIKDGEDVVNENNELKGSIACYKITIKELNDVLIQAILSLSTYNKKFVNTNNKKTINNVEYNIRQYIINPFINRINVELCLLYLYTLYDQMKDNK